MINRKSFESERDLHSTAKIMFTFMSLPTVQNMIHFIYFNSKKGKGFSRPAAKQECFVSQKGIDGQNWRKQDQAAFCFTSARKIVA